MKKSMDPRHLIRISSMQALFANSFREKKGGNEGVLNSIYANIKVIDKLIEQSAPQFPIEKISKIDVAILRLAVYELTIAKKEPPKVVIDEAIELAKEFGSETS